MLGFFRRFMCFRSKEAKREVDLEKGTTVEETPAAPAGVDAVPVPEANDVVVGRADTLTHSNSEASPTPSEVTLVDTPAIPEPKDESCDVSKDTAETEQEIIARAPFPYSPQLKVTSETAAVAVAHFKIDREIAHGCQGAVLLVQHRVGGGMYALKVSKKSAGPVAQGMAIMEQRILRALAGSPWYVSLKASFEDHENLFLLTDVFFKGDMHRRIHGCADGRLADGEARKYCSQIVLALEDLHQRRIVHRDIKPSNILLNVENEAVLADFGFARAFGPLQDNYLQDSAHPNDGDILIPEPLTSSTTTDLGFQRDITNSQCGTLEYMAPEVWYRQPYSYPVDVWSFGVMMYEMLYGKLPFNLDRIIDEEDGTEVDIFEAVCLSDFSLEADDTIDEDAIELVGMILQRDPSKRPSWQQIKAHPWFCGVKWRELYSRNAVPAPTALKSAITDRSKQFSFGCPYLPGDEQYPSFQWTSPELQPEPEAPTEAPPQQPISPPTRDNTTPTASTQDTSSPQNPHPSPISPEVALASPAPPVHHAPSASTSASSTSHPGDRHPAPVPAAAVPTQVGIAGLGLDLGPVVARTATTTPDETSMQDADAAAVVSCGDSSAAFSKDLNPPVALCAFPSTSTPVPGSGVPRETAAISLDGSSCGSSVSSSSSAVSVASGVTSSAVLAPGGRSVDTSPYVLASTLSPWQPRFVGSFYEHTASASTTSTTPTPNMPTLAPPLRRIWAERLWAWLLLFLLLIGIGSARCETADDRRINLLA